MKRSLFIAFLLIGLNTNAQVFKAGVVAGIAGCQVEGDGYGGYEKLGFIGGGFVNTELSEKWIAQFEIYFINKGSFNAANPDKGDYDSFNFNANYIEIPVSIGYRYNKFTFEAGPYIAKYLSHSVSDENGKRQFINYPIKSFDIGGFVGVGYSIDNHFTFNLRSKSSLLPFRDFQNFDQNIGLFNKLFNQGWYHIDINFSIRYQFGE